MSTPSQITGETANEKLEPIGLGMDDNALVFRNGDRVLRAIHPGKEAFFEGLVNHPVMMELTSKGLLLPVKKSARCVQGHSLVLEQPLMETVTFPFEWAASMFQAAAAALLRINIELMQHGYCTKEGHLWNFLFEGASPRFVDFTSIVKFSPESGWPGDGEFESICLSTLKLMEKGYPTEARALLREVRAHCDPALANAVLFNTKRYKRQGWRGDLRKIGDVMGCFGGKLIQRIKNCGQTEHWRADADQLKCWLEQVEAADVRPTRETWSDYYGRSPDVLAYDGSRADIERLRSATAKHLVITELLERTHPKTVLDLACNRGLYSQFAALQGARVIGADTDEAALDMMFGDIAKLGTNAQPIFLNVMCPAEAISFRAKPFPSVVNRVRSECVFCLALTHHFVFRPPFLKFPDIAQLLADFSSRHLVVEFVPLADRSVRETLAKRSSESRLGFGWYTLENYETAFHRHFAKIERFNSFPNGRVILFCQDKRD